jgi:uncharacterized coiled-coil protein SlyX
VKLNARRPFLRAKLTEINQQLFHLICFLDDAFAKQRERGNYFDRSLRDIARTQKKHTDLMDGLIQRSRTMAKQQERLNALVDRLGTASEGLRQDIADLKAAADAGEELDFSNLESRVEELASLDASTPAPAPADSGASSDAGSSADGGPTGAPGEVVPVESEPTA